MVIACEHCNTRFQLDDARIPDIGVRVRCSRCKTAFFVAPPGGEEAGLHAAAADAAVAGSPAVPAAAEDLQSQPEDVGQRGDGDVEEDWQFNIPGRSVAESDPNGLQPEAAPEAVAASSAAVDTQEPVSAVESPLESADNLDLRGELFGGDLGAPEEESGTEAESAADELFGSSDRHLGTEEDEFVPEATDVSPSETRPVVEPDLEDLGRPEDWDFLGDTPAPVKTPEAAADAAAGIRAAPLVETASEPEPVTSRPWKEPSRWMVWLDAAGWLACAVLVLVGVSGVMTAPPEATIRNAPTAELGPLRLQDLRAAVVENVHAGPVWVFRGTLVNPLADAARAEAVPRLTLLDAEGEVVGEAWFGRSVSDVALRERKPVEVTPRSRAATRELGRRILAGGEELALIAIVERLPAGAVSWQVDPAALPPGPPSR